MQNDIEKAIEYWQSLLKRFEDKPDDTYWGKEHKKLSREKIGLAIEELQEKQERDKGCEFCKDNKITLHIPKFEAAAIVNQYMNHESFDFELKPLFCPYCGRKVV